MWKALSARGCRTAAGAPLLLPLCAVVAALLIGRGTEASWLPVLGVFPVLLLAAVWRLWRIGCMALVLVLISAVQLVTMQEHSAALRAEAERNGELQLSGTVERTLRRGCIVGTGLNGARVAVYGEGTAYWRMGDRVRMRLLPQEDTAPLFPGMYDAEAWRRAEGLAGSYRLLQAEVTGHPWSWAALRGWGSHARSVLARHLMPDGTEKEAERQVLCALVLGAKEEADDETLATFRRGGCLHIFAVSGLHVGMVSALLWWLLGRCRLRPVVLRPLILLLVGAYVLVTGAAVPALRAYLMLAVYFLSFLLRRPWSALNTWCFAALLTLMPAPYQLGNAGFLLSFAVYAAIGLGCRFCLQHDRPWFGPDAAIPFTLLTRWELWWKAREQWLRGIVVVSLCAWLMALPLSAFFFHTVNTTGFLVNMAAAPLSFIVMAAGLLHLLLGGLPWVGVVTSFAAVKSAACLLALVNVFGNLPFSYLPTSAQQKPDTILVLPLGYGMSCCVLGNPGVVIEPGGSSEARYLTAPALFSGGLHPAALLPLRHTSAAREGAAMVLREQPQAKLLEASSACFRTAAGRYTLFPAAVDAPKAPQANHYPILLWEPADTALRVMYVGDASRLTWERIPPEERRADILILGAHPSLPLADAETWQEMGVRSLILLPSAAATPLPAVLPFQVYRVPEDKLLLRVSELSGTSPSAP